MVSERVRVVARVRPLKPIEAIDESESNIITNGIHELKVASHNFRFDRVYGKESTQQDIFQSHFVEEVDNVLDGENSTIIAFGQTAAGKTYTLTGLSTESEEGIIPRSLRRIFENQRSPVMISYVEIHNEKLRDLLDKGSKIVMLGNGTIKDATTKSVNTMKKALAVVKQGETTRTVASTFMNDASSRSHAILFIQLQSGSRLVVVDLAGSEMVKKTGASGQILEEAGCINKSLTSLAMVISALSSVRKPVHIPFRDSKLTQILQPALIGRSRLSLIINCSPAKTHLPESLSSLRFGLRCKSIRVNPSVDNVLGAVSSLVSAKLELEMVIRKIKLGIPVEIMKIDCMSKFPEFVDANFVTSHLMLTGKTSTVYNKEAQASHNQEMAALNQVLKNIHAQIDFLHQSREGRQIPNVIVQTTREYTIKLDYQIDQLHALNELLTKISNRNAKLGLRLANLRNKPLMKRTKEHLDQLGAEAHHHFVISTIKQKKV